MENEKYFTNELLDQKPQIIGHNLGLRGRIALVLIEKYGSIAGKRGKEDSQGRAALELQDPKELVDRCFKIVELFVETAEQKGEMRKPIIPIEQAILHGKRMEQFKYMNYDEAVKKINESTK